MIFATFVAAALLASTLAGCSAQQRERAARTWCDSADNCTVYDERGKPISRYDYCEGNDNCRLGPGGAERTRVPHP